MKKALLIAEKKSVADEIQKAYNKIKNDFPLDIDFTYARGHLVELCEPDEYHSEWGTPWRKDVLPIIPQKWKTKISVPDVFNNIKKLYDSKKYDYIINAGDAGREGQLIQHLIYNKLNVNIPVLRLWADDVTEKTLVKALKTMKSDSEYAGLTSASFLRLYMDWLIGINFSRAASLSLERSVSIGRVMTVVLAMIVNRERKIEQFVPKQYYELDAEFKLISGYTYKGTLINPKKENDLSSPYGFYDKGTISDILSKLSSSGVVTDIVTSEKTKKAPALYSLSELQKDSSSLFGFSPSKTLSIAESLYLKKYLTYPRTESKCLSSSQIDEIPNMLKAVSVIKDLSPICSEILNNTTIIKNALASKKYVDDKKVSDHPAITPTYIAPDYNSLSSDEKAIYDLVARRLVAIFMPYNIISTTTVITNVDGYEFKSIGSKTSEVGWKAIYEPFNSKDTKSIELPHILKNDSVKVEQSSIVDCETTPPKRYTNSSIIEAMETAGRELSDEELEKMLLQCNGLGTSATRGEIIDKLERLSYISRQGKKDKVIKPLQEGIELIDALNSLNNQYITSAEFTAKWEQRLKEVETGKCSYNDFYNSMLSFIKYEVEKYTELKPLGQPVSIIGICPLCKKREFVLSKKFGCCMGFFDKDENGKRVCELAISRSYGKTTLSEKDVAALIEKGSTPEKTFTWNSGKQYNTFLKLTIDKNNSPSFKIDFASDEDKETLGTCPICKRGRVISGTKGYFCTNNSTTISEEKRCSFSLYGYIHKTKISKTIIKQILKSGESNKEVKVKYNSGKSFSGILTLNEQYKLAFKPFEIKKVCKCPVCIDGFIMAEKYNYQCSNYKVGNCNMKFANKFLESTIDEKDVISLVDKKKITKLITFKDGKTDYKDLSLCLENNSYLLKF